MAAEAGFNQETIWPPAFASEADRVLSAGRDHGLGIRALQNQGITGDGVTMANIDQNICLDNPEYRGKLAEYHDVGTGHNTNSGSMHGPAVLSLLAGDSIG
jgi:serine protease AprX